MGYCNDCGCRTSDGICSNCHEELWIREYQGDFIENVSDEFLIKASEQEKQIEREKIYSFFNCPNCGNPNISVGTGGNWWCQKCKSGRRL